MKTRIGYCVLIAIWLATLGFGLAPSAVMAASTVSDEQPAFVPGQLMVGFGPSQSLGTTAGRAQSLAWSLGAKVLKTDANGMALLEIGSEQNVVAMAARAKRVPGVRYAEPNYVYKLDDPAPVDSGAGAANVPAAVPALAGSSGSSVFPNDPYLWDNLGWSNVAADIVWSNTTPSKEVCLLSTGVDYTHKDLAANIIKGFDYVNDDADPMDDNGGGTHEAGIIAAIRNNGEGIAGVSTGKVLAVKVMDLKGQGEAYEIAQGIDDCAANSSVSILDISFYGPASQTLHDAIVYATGKGKLVIAAAGDKNSPADIYPAAYSPTINGVAAVAASGAGSGPNYACPVSFTPTDTWINLVAPGSHILSTTPWDRDFYLDYQHAFRYDYFSGTAQAAAFTAGAAARVWGYLPSLTNAQVITRLRQTGSPLNTTNGCWPTNLSAVNVNVAAGMDRGAASLWVEDASSGATLTGALVSIYATASPTKLAGSGKVPPIFGIDPILQKASYNPPAAILNLPATTPTNGGTTYFAKVSANGYTASPQTAIWGWPGNGFAADGSFKVYSGSYTYSGGANIPPKSANFTVIAEGINLPTGPDLTIWLPKPNPTFIVSGLSSMNILNNSATWGPVLPYGTLLSAPYARWFNTASSLIQLAVLANRKTDTAAPWYPGDYVVGMTDGNFSPNANILDSHNTTLYVWKDGVLQQRIDYPGCGASYHWWIPLTIHSPAPGPATYTIDTLQTVCHAGPITY